MTAYSHMTLRGKFLLTKELRWVIRLASNFVGAKPAKTQTPNITTGLNIQTFRPFGSNITEVDKSAPVPISKDLNVNSNNRLHYYGSTFCHL
jgi:hypothetical protein